MQQITSLAPQPVAIPAPLENKSILHYLRVVAQSVIALVTLVTFVGFVFSAITTRQTSLFSLAVFPNYYIVMGGLILFLIAAYRLIPCTVVVLASVFLWFLIVPQNGKRRFDIGYSQSEALAFAKSLLFPRTFLNIMFWLVILSLVLDGVVHPEQIVGPARSSSARLIFKEDIDPSLWHLSTLPDQPRSTQPLSIVLEYTDGLLVRDHSTGAYVKVKNEVIAGIVDDASLSVPNVGTPAPTAATTPTHIGAITPTP